MKKVMFLIISLLIIPSGVFAYSEKIIVGGKTLGIRVDSKGVMVIGFYKVNGKLQIEDYKVDAEWKAVENTKYFEEKMVEMMFIDKHETIN